jgi:hypothetical protein
MKVRDVLKKSAVMVVDIVEKKEDYTTLATIDYHMNNKEGLHIDGKYYSSSVYLDLERPDIMDKTVDFFTAGTLFGYNDSKSYIGLTIYVK